MRVIHEKISSSSGLNHLFANHQLTTIEKRQSYISQGLVCQNPIQR